MCAVHNVKVKLHVCSKQGLYTCHCQLLTYGVRSSEERKDGSYEGEHH